MCGMVHQKLNVTFPTMSQSRQWHDRDLADLVDARCRASPPSFKNIAHQLNRTYLRSNQDLERPFTAKELIAKWCTLFPASQDANKTVQYLNDLQKTWPGLYFHTEKENSRRIGVPPKLIALHIVWSWSVDIMTTLQSSIFCDATFNVTVYAYKVVMITTLDGNQQHRPLMCSFITRSTGAQWSTIFDIFKTRSLNVP